MDYSINENLLQGLRDKETAAFEYLHQKSFQAVLTLTEDSPYSWEDAEDLYNDAIIILLKKIKKPDFVIKVNLQAMLYTICRNNYKNTLRKEKAKQNYLNELPDDSSDAYIEAAMDHLLHTNILWNNLKKLKEDCQKIIKKYMDESGSKKIAEDMGFTPMYARKKISLCLKALDNHVKEDHDYLRLLKNDEIDLM